MPKLSSVLRNVIGRGCQGVRILARFGVFCGGLEALSCNRCGQGDGVDLHSHQTSNRCLKSQQ